MTLAFALRLTEILLGLAFFQQSLEHFHAQKDERHLFLPRLVLSLLLMLGFHTQWVCLALVILGLLILKRFQGPYNGGSDRMGLLILCCLCLIRFLPAGPGQELVFGYLALQLVLSYFIAGWVKIANPQCAAAVPCRTSFYFPPIPSVNPCAPGRIVTPALWHVLGRHAFRTGISAEPAHACNLGRRPDACCPLSPRQRLSFRPEPVFLDLGWPPIRPCFGCSIAFFSDGALILNTLRVNHASGARMIIVLMGVTASGKTTVGKLLADRTGAIFADADDYHSAQNKAKMAAGHPLNDQDRQPWLETLNGLLHAWQKSGTSGVLACSALKEKYRKTLQADLPARAAHFVFLDVKKKILAERLAHRQHAFMNPKLLDSQLKTLQKPHDALIVKSEKKNAGTDRRSDFAKAGRITG